jgi:hypothetical protein
LRQHRGKEARRWMSPTLRPVSRDEMLRLAREGFGEVRLADLSRLLF